MLLIITFALLSTCTADVAMMLDGKLYNFMFTTGDDGGHTRQENTDANGIVTGKYSYVDPNGNLREIAYKAGPGIGFQVMGDTGVDKKTADEAARLAATVTQPPEAPIQHHPHQVSHHHVGSEPVVSTPHPTFKYPYSGSAFPRFRLPQSYMSYGNTGSLEHEQIYGSAPPYFPFPVIPYAMYQPLYSGRNAPTHQQNAPGHTPSTSSGNTVNQNTKY